MRVNQYMLQVGIRKKITQLLEPVYQAQHAIEDKLVHLVEQTIASIAARLKAIEDDLYNSESRDDRLTRIEQRIIQCQLDTALSI